MGPCGDVRVAVQATLAWEEKGSDPRAQRGPVAGADTRFSRAPSIGVFGFLCPCGHEASFRRRASSFVGRPVCKPPERGARVPVLYLGTFLLLPIC